MHTLRQTASKAAVPFALFLLLTPVALAQGIVLESTPQAETLGAFDPGTVRFTSNATEDSILVTPRPRSQERPILLVPELHLDLDAQVPAPQPPRLLLPPQE